MPHVTPSDEVAVETAPVRRVPTQARSRARVERILDVASDLVVRAGVDELTTTGIARAAGIPVASIYQYFPDRDAILLAIVERDTAEMDDQIRLDLAAALPATVAELVDTVMGAFLAVYQRRPAFMRIWLRGRTNAAVHEHCRQHNRRIAAELFPFATAIGVIAEGTPPGVGEFAVEMGDRMFQIAFESDPDGDAFVIAEGRALLAAYLQRYAAG